jgi:hypothetical protein
VTWQATAPAGLTQEASASIGSNGTTVLIHAAENVIGIQLVSLQVNSIAVPPAGGIGSSWTAEDYVIDGNSVQYGAVEIGLSTSSTEAVTNSTGGIDLGGIVLDAGVNLKLVNGGAGGTNALRRCSATVVYIVLQP